MSCLTICPARSDLCGRQLPAARDEGLALEAHAGYPTDCRNRARLRGERVVRHERIPKGTPAEIVATLNKGVNTALVDEKFVAHLAGIGGLPMPMTPEQFGKLVADESEKWRKVVEFAGVIGSSSKHCCGPRRPTRWILIIS